MRIGESYRLRDIGWRQWKAFAEKVRMPSKDVADMGRSMAEGLPALVASEYARVKSEGLVHPVLDKLAEALTIRARSLTES
jgi:hypothetical protein